LGKLFLGAYVGGMAEQSCSSVMRALAARSNPSSAPMRHAKCSANSVVQRKGEIS
jgi:hypothetical protein